ncbi:MAG: PaaI family thioesterase [Parvibaculum sp.]
MQTSDIAEAFNANMPGSDTDPNTLRMLGFELQSWDEKTETIRVSFEAKPEFRNPGGIIQGGILAAMIDDAFGPLLIIATARTMRPLTLDLNVTYISAAQVGKFICEARIVRRGKSIAFVEGELFDAAGELIARATSTVKLVPMVRG